MQDALRGDDRFNGTHDKRNDKLIFSSLLSFTKISMGNGGRFSIFVMTSFLCFMNNVEGGRRSARQSEVKWDKIKRSEERPRLSRFRAERGINRAVKLNGPKINNSRRFRKQLCRGNTFSALLENFFEEATL